MSRHEEDYLMELRILMETRIMGPKKILRYLKSFISVILLAAGIRIIFDATSTIVHFNEFDAWLGKQYFYLTYLFYTVGVVMILIIAFSSFMRDNRCKMKIYCGLMVVVYLAELLIIYACYPWIIGNNTGLAENMNKTINLYDTPNNSQIAVAWDDIQEQFHCCGISGASDWISSTTEHKLPLSCCSIPYGAAGYFECNTDVAYKEGCLKVFRNDINTYIYYIEVFSISMAVLQGFGLFLSFCSYCYCC